MNRNFLNVLALIISLSGIVACNSTKSLEEGYTSLFNGKDLSGWVGNKESYTAKNGEIIVSPAEGESWGGNLLTVKEYSNFILRFEFQLTSGANNGLAIRAPLEEDVTFLGHELQILDNTADKYKDLKPYQYHGSLYGIMPAKRGYLQPIEQRNQQEVYVNGSIVKVTLNGTVILNGDLNEVTKDGTMDEHNHPGLQKKKGHIGFIGHGDRLKFRNISIKEL